MRTTALVLASALVLSACATTPEPAHAKRVELSADWSLADWNGHRHAAGDFLERGEPVVLVFWSTWCGACVEEAPAIEAAHRANPGLHVFGVVAGAERDVDVQSVRDTAARLDLSYPQVMDRDLELTRSFGVLGTPTIVVLGRGGEVLYYDHEAPARWDDFAG